MRTLTLEGIYHNGFVEVQDPVKFKDPMRVLVVFIDELKPKPVHKFSFAKSLELTKNCKGKLSDEVINERRTEKW
jgi:hypothetical protein